MYIYIYMALYGIWRCQLRSRHTWYTHSFPGVQLVTPKKYSRFLQISPQFIRRLQSTTSPWRIVIFFGGSISFKTWTWGKEGMPIELIAKVLEISVAAVKWSLERVDGVAAQVWVEGEVETGCWNRWGKPGRRSSREFSRKIEKMSLWKRDHLRPFILKAHFILEPSSFRGEA